MTADRSTAGEFRRLWKEIYGQEITYEQAEAYEERWVQFMKIVVALEQEQRERSPP